MNSEFIKVKKGFIFGVSSAAYQTEGAWNIEGKGPSIWDEFTHRRNRIKNKHTGDIACDYYFRYPEDIDIMYRLGIRHFRFSISWSRIMPDGISTINEAGIKFYHSVIDYCLQYDIEPWITLYHWDLPLELQQRGGWANRDIIGWFSNYVSICIKHFGDKVTNWIILNEPVVFTGAGYMLGVHAPGIRNFNHFLPSVHHAALCQSEGGRIIRSLCPQAQIGTTFSCSLVEPASPKLRDFNASVRVDALLNRLFVEPLAGLGYPVKELPWLSRMEKYIKDGDITKLQFKMDFIGIQNYTREIVKHSPFIPFIRAVAISANKRGVKATSTNWEIYPEGIYYMLKKMSSYTLFNRLIVTENGAAFDDIVSEGEINDDKRVEFLSSYIKQVLLARDEGVNVEGYFVWSLTDNFEWAHGFYPRFGLVYIDYKTQQRIIKNSGYWYQNFIQSFVNRS